ncbi:MAG: hypothetical protein PVG66_11595 [Chromatiales bacterium]|jgi:hypothetical protein
MSKKKYSRQYLIALVVLLGIVFFVVFAVNSAVDPLWYFSGNRITKRNYAFDERLAKMNHFVNEAKAYDCYVFGSSRATLLNASKIAGYNCYNFAFSGGRVEEIVAYARYLRNRYDQPRLVIIGVDDFNFFARSNTSSLPVFIHQNTSPPGWLKNYLTYDALKFSIRTLTGDSPLPRYYRADFSAAIKSDAGPYKPEINDIEEERKKDIEFNDESVGQYGRLRDLFPDSRLVFYVPPVSVWRITRHYEQGQLDFYLDALHEISRLGSGFYDFSVPSVITRDAGNTYDGSHYSLKVNEMIVQSINSGNPSFGIRVDGMDKENYVRTFYAALRASMIVSPGNNPQENN